jgi:ABC-type transporter Mla subunit MlaD
LKPKANELVAGIFVILMVLSFLIFLSWSSGGIERWFAEKRPAITWFNNIGGLKENVQVVYQGFPIGDVELIDYDPSKKKIRVRMSLKADFVDAELPARVVAMVTTSSLLGDPYIELTADYAYIDTALLVRGEDLVTRTPEGVLLIDSIDPVGWGTIQVQASRLITDIQDRFSTMSDTLGSILTSVDAVVSDPRLQADLKATVANANATVVDARATMADVRRTLPGMMANADSMMISAASAAGRVDSMIARSQDTIVRIVENADEIAVNTRALTYTLSERPSRLVWDDKERQRRLAEGDTTVIYGSWREAFSRGGARDTRAPRATTTARPTGRRMGNWANPHLATE